MKKLQKTALSLILACAPASAKTYNPITPPTTLREFKIFYNQDPTKELKSLFPVYPPKTLEGYANLFDTSTTREAERRYRFFEDTESQKIISKYDAYSSRKLRRLFGNHFPTEEEYKIVQKATTRTIKKAFKETYRDSPEIEEVQDMVFDFLNGFYLSIKGSSPNGYTGIPSLDEATRQDALERGRKIRIFEETVKDLGRRYRANFDGKINYNFRGTNLTAILQGFETSASLMDFQILGQKFHRFDIKAKSDQEVKMNLIKLLEDGWYAQLAIKYGCFPGDLEYISASLINEKPNSRLRIALEQNKRELRVSAGINLRH